MGVTNKQTGTRIDEIGAGIYRIHTPFTDIPGGFSFNQYLLADEQPLLFHTGHRGLAKVVQEAIATIIPLRELRFIGFSHFESDECGALNELLGLAPQAVPLCGQVNAMVNGDAFDRPPRALADGEVLSTGKHRVRWFDTPHLPHAWECGYLLDEQSSTLFCGDLLTQGGSDNPPVTEGDILESTEEFRAKMDYFSHTRNARPMLARLAATHPTTLACMHGSAWKGDGARMLGALADAYDR